MLSYPQLLPGNEWGGESQSGADWLGKPGGHRHRHHTVNLHLQIGVGHESIDSDGGSTLIEGLVKPRRREQFGVVSQFEPIAFDDVVFHGTSPAWLIGS
jgi:hypothetical protein